VNRVIGYAHLLMIGAGTLFCGALGLAFVTLSVYLAYTGITGGQPFRLRPLMMPMMNILISSVLFYYCRVLFTRTRALQRALAAGTYAPPLLRATRYDIVAIAAFLIVVGILFVYFFRP
jgi:hypothetical protein